MKYSIGSNLDNKSIFLINKLAGKYNIHKSNIEIFLSFPGTNFALNSSIIKKITKKDFIKHIKIIQSFGYNINYVINSPSINIKESFEKIERELILLKKIGIYILTITNIDLISKIQKKYPEFKISLSTVLNIDNVIKLEDILKKVKLLKINRIIFGFKVNKSLEIIKKMSNICKKKGIETEILVNQACFINCTFVDEHYLRDHIGQEKFECPYTINEDNYLDDISSCIDPKFIPKYKKLGIVIFKISTRNCGINALFNEVNDYFGQKINSNYIDKLGY